MPVPISYGAMNLDTGSPESEHMSRMVADHPESVDYDELLAASDGLRKPVLLRKMFANEAPTETWTLDRLLALEPDRTVTAEYYADADRRKAYEHVTLPCVELAASMADDPEKWYLAEQDLDTIFPTVSVELSRLSMVPADARSVLRLVFFGTNTQSGTHYHTIDQAVLVHLRGKKRVVLAGPKATRALATNSLLGGRPQFSTFGPEPGADALECFTDLVGSEAFVVDLDPGDALFIPVHWWHWVEGQGECLSVTTFWRASVKDWAFPQPGIRAVITVALGKVIKVVRRVAGWVGYLKSR